MADFNRECFPERYVGEDVDKVEAGDSSEVSANQTTKPRHDALCVESRVVAGLMTGNNTITQTPELAAEPLKNVVPGAGQR